MVMVVPLMVMMIMVVVVMLGGVVYNGTGPLHISGSRGAAVMVVLVVVMMVGVVSFGKSDGSGGSCINGNASLNTVVLKLWAMTH